MRRILGLEALTKPPVRSVVCVGKFFAVHRGHQALLRATVAAARERDAESLVLTFDRHPRELLEPGYAPPVLTSLEERLGLIAAEAPDRTLVLHVTPELLAQEPEDFISETLVGRLRAVEVLAGERFRFGRAARGTTALLREMGEGLGLTYTPVEAVLEGGRRVSSSRVAASVEAGRVAEAARLLGREYTVPGVVEEGERRGRELGFPTANVRVPPERLLPAHGVYVARLKVPSASLPAVANLGTRPTVGGERVVLEVHALDWSGDLYGRPVDIAFLERLREERRFPDLPALQAQIAADVAAARAFHAAR